MVKRSSWSKKLVLIASTIGIFAPIRAISVSEVISKALDFTWTTAQNHPFLSAATMALPAGFYSAAFLAQQVYYKKLYWNWDSKNIDTKKLIFPANFLFGAGSAAHQVESGCTDDTWSEQADTIRRESTPPQKTLKAVRQEVLDKEWENQKDLYIEHIQKTTGKAPTEEELDQHKQDYFTFAYAGDACKAQDNYKDDVQLLKRMGCTAYRFSVDWAKVMPKENEFDKKVVEFYIDFCDKLIKNKIKPVVTLYHYTEPIWFAEKGGFEKSENNEYFVTFCKKVMRELNTKVHLYLTFNSPIGGVALNSYQQGNRPPFKKDWETTFNVIKNILDAHVAVYKAKEEIEQEFECKLSVGILKNVHQLDPARVWHPVDQLVCSIGNKVQDDPFYQFFTTGKIDMEFPFGLAGLASHIPKLKDTYHPLKHVNEDAPGSLDFIGLNYYGHRFMKGDQMVFNEREERCGTPGNYHPTYTIYAEGLYRALKTLDEKLVKPLEKKTARHIPIYVTENGIGTDDDNQRNKFMSRYLYALSKAIQDGIDIRGYFCWSLLDNYEWGQYNKHYGLFKVNRETQERILKPGSMHYHDVMLAHKNLSSKAQWTVNDVTVTIKEQNVEEPTKIPQKVTA